MNKNKEALRKISLVSMLLAIAIALDVVTGLIPGLNLSMPLGGRLFNISLLPVLLIGIFLGPGYGITGAVIYGVFGFFYDGYALANFAQDLGQAITIFMLDYVIAFGALGLSGFFKNALKGPLSFSLTVVVPLLIRWVSSTVVGAMLWVGFATGNEWTNNLFNNLGQSAILYSGIYNILYTIPTIILLSAVGILTLPQLRILDEWYNPILEQ